MSNYTAKRIGDMEAAFGGGFVKARAELGVTSFGLQVIRMPPDYTDYPEHDHETTARRRSTWRSRLRPIEVDGERIDLTPDVLVRVGPGHQAQGLRGSRGPADDRARRRPGKAYEVECRAHRTGRGVASALNDRLAVQPQRGGGDQAGAGVRCRRAGPSRPASACSAARSRRAPVGTPARLRWIASASVPVPRAEAATVNGISSRSAVVVQQLEQLRVQRRAAADHRARAELVLADLLRPRCRARRSRG